MKKGKIESWDERRDLIILEDQEEMISFSVEHWIQTCKRSIQQRGRFAVALSGGSTPKAIYQSLSQKKEIDWEKVWLFWGDERAVPPDHPDSNYKMAMDAGFKDLPIPKSQIFRMVAEKEIEKNAKDYEEKIQKHLGKHLFDLVMLGMGEDGHTASLFPQTKALEETTKLVTFNKVEKKGLRMTLTFPCINQSYKSVFYVAGSSKKEMVFNVLNAPIESSWPSSKIGTSEKKALWVLDENASQANLFKPSDL